MKTINAVQNQDGTYMVTILNQTSRTKMNGESEIKEIIDDKIVVKRAGITITAYPDDRNDGELLSMVVKE